MYINGHSLSNEVPDSTTVEPLLTEQRPGSRLIHNITPFYTDPNVSLRRYEMAYPCWLRSSIFACQANDSNGNIAFFGKHIYFCKMLL